MDNTNMNFDEWIVAITKILGLDKNTLILDTFIKGEKCHIVLKQFVDVTMQHPDWQPTIMQMIDFICANKLFYNGRNYTEQDLASTKAFTLDYLADFTINAILAGYNFS